MILSGANAIVCPFDQRHAAATLDWANDLELARLLDRARPVSDVEHERWLAALYDRSDAVFFAIETTEQRKHVGNVWLWGIDARHRKAELRIVIGDAGHHGRGLGAEAIRLITNYAFERLNLQKVFAYVLATNPRGVRAFEKAGFVVEGTLKQDRWVGDRFADVQLLARIR